MSPNFVFIENFATLYRAPSFSHNIYDNNIAKLYYRSAISNKLIVNC